VRPDTHWLRSGVHPRPASRTRVASGWLALATSLILLQSGPLTLPAQTTSTELPAVRSDPATRVTNAGPLLTGAIPAPSPPSATGSGGVSTNADWAAARYATTCAGCHSLFGLKLTGPELTPATAWSLDQLKVAIKRMEKNVGPLTDDQVATQAELLKSPNVRERIQAEQERIQAQFRAKMEPPNAGVGRALFLGSAPLRNGGLPCAACHTAEGRGGNLGTNLAGISLRMGGETPLISAIEKASFRIMAPHYRRHPVTTQEAIHLAKYLSTLDPQTAVAASVAFAPIGTGGGAALLVGLTFYLRQQRSVRRRDIRLQRRRP